MPIGEALSAQTGFPVKAGNNSTGNVKTALLYTNSEPNVKPSLVSNPSFIPNLNSLLNPSS